MCGYLETPAAVGSGRKRAGIRDHDDGVAPPDVGFSVQGRRLEIYIGVASTVGTCLAGALICREETWSDGPTTTLT
ncbi:hypothetical protein GW17_00003551 [Ensete ventricosum]|nr:hypothetical protein GW17_00003551 [Ensete ventricosum]